MSRQEILLFLIYVLKITSKLGKNGSFFYICVANSCKKYLLFYLYSLASVDTFRHKIFENRLKNDVIFVPNDPHPPKSPMPFDIKIAQEARLYYHIFRYLLKAILTLKLSDEKSRFIILFINIA